MPLVALKINRKNDLKLIGIHNQDPDALYIQFSCGNHYFIYERVVSLKSEGIREQLFGCKEDSRDSLEAEDEQFLINRLRFLPQTRRAFRDYSF